MSYLNNLLFGIYPYIAIFVCLLGSWIRFDREAYTWKAGSSQMLNSKGMRVASNLFHVGVIFVLMGHFVGLLTPEAIYHVFISTENKQLLAMVSGGFFGLICLVGLVMLLKRRVGAFDYHRVSKSYGWFGDGATRHLGTKHCYFPSCASCASD